MKITRTQLKQLIKEEIKSINESDSIEWGNFDPNGVESPLAQRMAISDNFEDETTYSRESLIDRVIKAELDGGFKGIIDFVLDTDV